MKHNNTLGRDSDAVTGQRLRQIRLARGLSLDRLAAAMGGIITKQALSKYENGKAKPTAIVLAKLAEALRVKALDLWAEPKVRVELIGYRRGSALLKSEQARIESLVSRALEERTRVQELTEPSDLAELPVRLFPVRALEDAEQAADELRAKWKLGVDPIAEVVAILEDHHVHVLAIDAGEKFDGISAVAYEESRPVAAAVVTRAEIPGERERLNLAHELGHLVLQVADQVDEDKVAFRFAGAFLAPATTLRWRVGDRRAFISPEELLLLKRFFGMSVQALLYRCRDLGIISDSYYRRWCIDINRLGWKRREPGELPMERPQWLRQHVLRAVAEGLLAPDEGEQLLGETIDGESPIPLVERRAFMRLPLEERRRVLQEQALTLKDHYDQDREWRDLEVGDFVEY
jgi:Zn-dependent peptidase ImmA (M78 family)/DNA-binding XRE family transcriptional regulator